MRKHYQFYSYFYYCTLTICNMTFSVIFYFKICSSKLCWFHVYDYLPLGMIKQLNMLYRHGTGRHKGWKASLALLTYILCLITDLLCNYVYGTVGVLASSRVNILFMTILLANRLIATVFGLPKTGTGDVWFPESTLRFTIQSLLLQAWGGGRGAWRQCWI